MSCKDPRGAGEAPAISTKAEDERDQSAVLMHVLMLHPTHLTQPDLAREINAGSVDFAAGDAVERAVLELTGTGLLHCVGGLVLPTRAALRLTICSGVVANDRHRRSLRRQPRISAQAR